MFRQPNYCYRFLKAYETRLLTMAQAKQHTSCVFSVQHFQIMYIFLFLSKLTMASLREKDVSWTFNSPGLSLINFSLPLIQSSVFKLSFDFRTPQVNGALLHITLQNSDMLIITEETRKLLYGFNMFLELRQGYVKLIHTYDHYVDVLTIIKGKRKKIFIMRYIQFTYIQFI